MDTRHHDRVFIVTFLGVLSVLIGMALVFIVIARYIGGRAAEEINPVALQHIEDRIKPVATVVTDSAQLMKVSAPAKREARSGAEIVAQVCSSCHGAGVLGAPKIGDQADWSARAKTAGGLDGLAKVAAAGKNQMPPRGGDASLSDAELKAAIGEMLARSGLSH